MSFWSRKDGICFLLCFAGALAVYVFSLAPSVTLEDAGELAVAADYLGVPHPPGYPIWTFFAWFFQWIFHRVEFRGYPNPAWSVALMSAFFGSVACGLVSVCIRKLIITLPPDPGTPTPGILPSLKREATGSLLGVLFLTFHLMAPAPGKALLTLSVLLFGYLLTLQVFTHEDHRFSWQKFVPAPVELGQGFWGFLAAIVCWLVLWYWVILPAPGLMLPFVLCALIVYYLVSFGFRWALRKAFQRPDLSTDIQRSRMDLTLGIGGGLLLAFTPLMWSQSVIIEVYSLNAFFLSSLLLLVLWYIQQPQDRILYISAFLFALGLTNHQSLLFLIFFLVAGVAAARAFSLLKDGLFLMGVGILGFFILKSFQYQKLEDGDAARFFILLSFPVVFFLILLVLTRGGLFRKAKQLGVLLLLGILGISFHLYMPLASEQNPPMNWGNARTVEGFKHSITRGQYAKFSIADNVKLIGEMASTPPPAATDGKISSEELNRYYIRRTLFLRMMGTFFYDANWKYSIANQFSWQYPVGDDDPTGVKPPPPERHIPFALLGLIPLLCFGCFSSVPKGWFISSILAMFFLTVVFLTIQWPELNHNDLWVKRVQYVQAHVLFSVWMALGASILVFMLYAAFPRTRLLGIPSLILCGIFIVFPLHKDARDPRHLEQLGSSNLHGHDFGWQYGFYQLKGANGILLDELAHHKNPDCLVNEWAVDYLQTREFPSEKLKRLKEQAGQPPLPRSDFRKKVLRKLDLTSKEKRLLEQAVTMAAFRALSPREQQEALVYLHRPLPDWDYPPEMDQHAILFGGTDPGRFVPTYMIFSAEVRTDLYIVTQTALADSTYQNTIRDLYGDRIFLPDLVDGNEAFVDYGNQLRLFHPEAFFSLMGRGETLSINGVSQVNELNSLLTKKIFEQNRANHSFYFEEALQMKWMIPHQRPHGLIFKIEPEPTEITQTDIEKDFAFWKWVEEHLLGVHPEEKSQRNRYSRDLPVRKSFSKLRMAQAWNYYERGHWVEADLAMDQAQRLYPANPEAALRAGDMYIRMLKFDRAEEVLDAFSLHDPTNYQRVNFSVSLRKLRDLYDLREELEQDYELKPADKLGNLALQLMQIYGQLEMKKQMIEMANVILQRPNLHVDFYIHLAAFMQQEENHEYYRKAVEKWGEKAPRDARPFIDLAAISLSEGDFNSMANYMVLAIQLDPEQSRAQLRVDPRFVDIHHWEQFRQLIGLTSSKEPAPDF